MAEGGGTVSDLTDEWHGIVMSRESVVGISRGLKTQSRRLAKLRPGGPPVRSPLVSGGPIRPEPYGGGDSWVQTPGANSYLWVKETYSTDALTVYPCPRAWYRSDFDPMRDDPALRPAGPRGDCLHETADASCFGCAMGGRKFRWKSPRFMPRRLARHCLRVEAARLHRLFDITEDDARAEGVPGPHFGRWLQMNGLLEPREDLPPRPWAHSFLVLWQDLHGSDLTWSNPWVWAYTFRQYHG